jgi:hypothetical protein
MRKLPELRKELQDLQSKVIGLFQNYARNTVELVMEETNDTIITIEINNLLEIRTHTQPKIVGKLEIFGGSRSLLEMRNDYPAELYRMIVSLHGRKRQHGED